MAIYLKTNTETISYVIGDNMTTPVRCLFLISDEELDEQNYRINYPNDEYEVIALKKATKIQEQFYYSLPWKLIKSINNEINTIDEGGDNLLTDDPTPTPTQTPWILLDGIKTYKSEPNGYFDYTVHNKSNNSTYNDVKYFHEIKKAFDKWDSVILENPYTIIENGEQVNWNLNVAVEFDSLESGTLEQCSQKY